MKYGVATYGMNVWFGGDYDPEERWARLREIGYDGVEHVSAASADDAVVKAARLHKLGMDFATVSAPTPELSIQWTAAFGNTYIWAGMTGDNFDELCRKDNLEAEAAARWGVKTGLHNHMGMLVETQPQLESFLDRCPNVGLILDTAHLAAAGGDPVAIVRKYADRLVSMHLKDWFLTDPGADHWFKTGRFCELGAGNIGLDNIAVMRALVEVGYDGWVFVEQDTHLQDPYIDLAKSREYLKKAGF